VAKPVRVEELVAALGRSPQRRDAGARETAATHVGGDDALAGSRRPASRRRPAGAAPHAPGAQDGPEIVVVDRATLERLTATMGGPFVVELIDTFVEDGRELIATMRRTLAETDLDAFRRAAHSLKSTGETVGAGGLAALARELEALARGGSLRGADAQLERLAGAYEIVTRTLGELRRDLRR
jgi:HPt (histidine-containing phosphotransfer) domain-containing protein